jgi:hypothetical protein
MTALLCSHATSLSFSTSDCTSVLIPVFSLELSVFAGARRNDVLRFKMKVQKTSFTGIPPVQGENVFPGKVAEYFISMRKLQQIP